MKRMIFCALALVLLAVACRKEEFQQLPHGEKVPFTDTAVYDLKTLSGMSAAHRLFHAAWQKSNLDAAIAALGAKAQVTVFAPDDAAMRAAGFNETAIAAASQADLDSLLLFHVVISKLDSVAAASLPGNVMAVTLLKHNTLQEQLNNVGDNTPRWQPYRFKQFVCLKNGRLLLNGKDAGNARPLMATNGILWPVSHVAQCPRESMIDFLRRDPRFTIFSRLVHETDSAWQEISMGIVQRGIYAQLAPQDGTGVYSDAFFAPTDDAFRKAGFNSIDDLWRLNARSMPYLDLDWYEVYNRFVTDSLLAYHTWGRYYAPSGGWGQGKAVPAIFFSNDLRNDYLADFDVNARENLANLPAYPVPLDFGTEGGQVTVKVKGSTHPAARIIEADIYTYQGPVHVVDQLILSNKVQF